MISIVRAEGVRSLYTGCGAFLVGNTTKVAFKFFSVDFFKTKLADENG
jgi:solute carrier family 25 citrate transporter 1